MPDITLRNLSENKTILGGVTPINKEKGAYQINLQNIDIPITKRNLSENKSYLTPILKHGQLKQPQNRNQDKYINVTKDELTVIKNSPTPISTNLGPTFDFTHIELKTPLNTNRDIYGTSYNQSFNRLPIISSTNSHYM